METKLEQTLWETSNDYWSKGKGSNRNLIIANGSNAETWEVNYYINENVVVHKGITMLSTFIWSIGLLLELPSDIERNKRLFHFRPKKSETR